MIYLVIGQVGHSIAKWLKSAGYGGVAIGVSAILLIMSGWFGLQHVIMGISVRSFWAVLIGAAFFWNAYENWLFLTGKDARSGIREAVRVLKTRRWKWTR
jgi:hypothetical protein